ncbi:MAG: extracellular solute-binding protein [Sphaerochaetaceae bacterium]|nr:extracellular solute-binding protein [Sphaerochaetaceae bacterium]MDC7248977.1 extracellular solute-binding protein [Sphaerochaetaceae bacterium]
MRKFILVLVSLAMGVSLFANGAKEAESQKLVFWDKSEYVQAYNEQSKAHFEEFCEANGIEGEYIIIPPNDLKQKLLASIEAGNPPDIIVTDDFSAKQYAGMGQLLSVDSVTNAIDFTQTGKNIASVQNGNYIVPMCVMAPGFYIRSDKWEEKGLDLPTTWEELFETAKIVNDPENGFYALGYPMGASGGGDAESMCRSIILSFGGVPIDENGNVTINSPETLEALKFIASLYTEGLCPPSAITWDDMGNNTAYTAGSVGVIQNSGSVFSQLKEEYPDLLEKTAITSYPSGPYGTYIPTGGNVFCVFKNGSSNDMALKYVEYFFEKDFYENLLTEMQGMWQPTIDGVTDNDFWKDPANAGWLAASQNGVPNTYPAPVTDLTTLSFSEQLCVKAIQQIVLNGVDPQKALDDLEQSFKDVLGQ